MYVPLLKKSMNSVLEMKPELSMSSTTRSSSGKSARLRGIKED